MTTRANPGIHPSQTLRVIRLLEQSQGAHERGEDWKPIYAAAERTSPDAVAGITGGMTMGDVPQPGTSEWNDWKDIQEAHLLELIRDDNERVHICHGGPLDGKVYAEPKAFLPVQNMMPTPAAGRTSAWPDAWDASVPRYMPHWDACDEPVRMVWTTPDQAEQIHPRPESIKDYSDYGDYGE